MRSQVTAQVILHFFLKKIITPCKNGLPGLFSDRKNMGEIRRSLVGLCATHDADRGFTCCIYDRPDVGISTKNQLGICLNRQLCWHLCYPRMFASNLQPYLLITIVISYMQYQGVAFAGSICIQTFNLEKRVT